MSVIRASLFSAAVAAVCLSLPAPAFAQDDKSRLREQVLASLPEPLKDPSRLVGNLLGIDLAQTQLNFDIGKAVPALFPGQSPFFAADCRRRATPIGDADQGDCIASVGSENGAGAYSRLSFSKNPGVGNIKFLKRGAAPASPETTLPPPAGVGMSDAQALADARTFLSNVLGVPLSEIPEPPAGAGSPVRNLAIGFDSRENAKGIVIQKVVTLQRGFKLPEAIPFQTPQGTPVQLTHVMAPGKAMVALNDGGVVGAGVRNWQLLRKDPKITADRAKTMDQLVDEITDDLFNEGGTGAVGELKFAIVLSSEWRGTFGLLLPAVQVFMSPVPVRPDRDLTEEEQKALALKSTAGYVGQYSLVDLAEGEVLNR
jgi:hypothetical protein